MASSQPIGGGARPKTNLQSNSRHQTSRKEKSFRTKNPSSQQGRENCDNLSGTDIEKDAVPNSEQGNVPPGFHVPPVSPPYLVDVAVIYAKEDYDEVVNEFVPWLRGIAEKFNCEGARIHLYDDIDVNTNTNIFSQADTMAVKCMKILAFITNNFMKDKILKGVLEELIMMTRFVTEDEVEQHISKISENLNAAKYLAECVQRQKTNALIPVKTGEKNIIPIGLKSIVSIDYYDHQRNSGFKKNKAQGVIKVAMEERRKLQKHIPQHMDWSSYHDQNREESSWKNRQAESQCDSEAQLISKSLTSTRNLGNPVENRQQNNNFTDDDTSDECNETETQSSLRNQLGPNNNVSSLGQEIEPKSDTDDGRRPTTDINSESSNTVGVIAQASLAEPALEVAEDQDEGLGSECQSQVSLRVSPKPEPKTLVHSDPAATPASSNRNDTPEDDLEIDQLESRRANNTEIKTKFSAITESGYDSISGHGQLQQKDDPKPVKEPEETSLDNTGLENDSVTSLDNTGLVNDSGDAALKKDAGDANMKFSKQESMLSIDAHKDEKESPLCSKKWQSSIEDQNKVLEHTLTYTGMAVPSRGLMAGNVPQKDSDKRCPAGSDMPDSCPHMTSKQPPDISQTLLPYLTGTKEGPVLTIVHHHLYERSEPKPPSPPPTKPEQHQTINVYGANSVMIGKHSKTVMSEPSVISTSDTRSDQPEPDVVPTKHQTSQKGVQSDTGTEFPSSTPTTSSGSLNDLSPSLQPSAYNFTKSAEQTDEWKETDCQDLEGKKAADQNEETKKLDSCEDSSSDEDNSVVDTQRQTENNFEITKETNLNDTEGHNQITNESNLSSFEVTCNSSWQSEAENVLGPSFTNEFESLAASGEDTIQPHQWDVVKPGDCITNGQQNEAADHEGQGQVGTETQLSVIGGPNLSVSSMQSNSLFVSTRNVHHHYGNLNVLGVMAQRSGIFPEIGTVYPKQDDDDVD